MKFAKLFNTKDHGQIVVLHVPDTKKIHFIFEVWFILGVCNWDVDYKSMTEASSAFRVVDQYMAEQIVEKMKLKMWENSEMAKVAKGDEK